MSLDLLRSARSAVAPPPPSPQGGPLSRLPAPVVAGGAAVVVAGLGGALTDIGPWYYALRKPSWQPPDWAFPVAWTAIFGLAAWAGARAWREAPSPADRRRVAWLFGVNGVLNAAWSGLFFKLRRPDWGLVEVVPLWLSVLALVVETGRRSRFTGALLAPYLVWVGFAAVLNLAIVRLNAPFGR